MKKIIQLNTHNFDGLTDLSNKELSDITGGDGLAEMITYGIFYVAGAFTGALVKSQKIIIQTTKENPYYGAYPSY